MSLRVMFLADLGTSKTSAPKTHFFSLASGFLKAKSDVQILLVGRTDSNNPEDRLITPLATRIREIAVPLRSVRDLGRAVQAFWIIPPVLRELLKHRSDFLFVRFNPSWLPLFVCIRLLRSLHILKVRIIADVNGWLSDQRRLQGDSRFEVVVSEILERCSLRLVDQARVVTNGLRDKLQSLHFHSAFVVGNGTDTSHFKPLDRKTRNGYVVGFLGHLTRWQGLPTLLNAIPTLLKRIPNARFVIGGDGPEKEALEAQIKKLGISEQVHLIGSVPYEEAPKCLNSFDCAVAPFSKARNESIGLSPLKVADTAACGIPLITSRIPGLEIVEREELGILVPPDDPEALATAIETLLLDTSKRARISQTARVFAEKNHSWDSKAEQIVAYLRSLRVLHVTNMYPTEKNPRFGSFVASQIRSLEKIGLAIDVVSFPGHGIWKYFIGFFSALWKRMTGPAYDLVHVHYGLTLLPALPLIVGRPSIVSFCGSDILGPKWVRALSIALSRLCGTIIVKSDEMKMVVEDRGRFAHVIPTGVNLERFRPLNKEEARKKLNLDSGKRYVLFAADPDLQPHKRIDLARKAVELARKEDGSLELLIVCDRPQEEMPYFINASDCVLLTSDWEGSPNIVKEAMACDVPVVSVDVGDVRTLFKGTSGYTISSREPAELAKALLTAVQAKAIGRATISRMSDREVAHEIERLYSQLLHPDSLSASAKQNRVLVLLHNTFTTDSRVLKECTTLVEAGYEVELRCMFDEKLPEREVINGFTVRRLFRKSPNDTAGRRLIRKLRDTIVSPFTRLLKPSPFVYEHTLGLLNSFESRVRQRREKQKFGKQPSRHFPFDIIHCNDLRPLPYAVELKKKHPHVKLVYDSHEYQTEVFSAASDPTKKRQLELVERTNIPFVDEVITVSPSIGKQYEALYGLKKVHVVKNCPPVTAHAPRSTQFQSKFGLSSTDIVFLFQGGLVKNIRGIEEIISAFIRLKESGYRQYHIVFMGFGDLEGEIATYAKTHSNIHLHPAVHPNQIAEISTSADYGIIFYPNNCKNHYYCLPNKLFEYMACGLPVVVSPLYEMRNLVQYESIGIVTGDFTADSLVQAIRNITLQPSAHERDRIQNLHRTKYSWDVEKVALLNIYKDQLLGIEQ
jgi:glycosyltransferase involved in cell wall biosynthesis